VVTLTSTKPDLKFIHCADTHLGLNWPPIGRKGDIQIAAYGRAFASIIDTALTNHADFVVHGGDLVDRPRPPTAAWNRILEELPKLKNAGIPFIVAPGSHDKPASYFDRAGGDVLEILEKRLGLVRRVEVDSEPAKLQTKSGKNVTIYGLGDHGSDQEEELKKLKATMRTGSEFKILVMHGSVSSMPILANPTVKSETVNDLFSSGFIDYVALGHNHKRWEHKQTHIYNPGSPEITSFADAPTISYSCNEDRLTEQSRETIQHGYYMVEVSGEIINSNFTPLPTRDVKNAKISFSNATASQVSETTKKTIALNASASAIIRPILNGTLHPSISRNEINLQDILSTKEKVLYLEYPIFSFDQSGGEILFSKTSDLQTIFQNYYSATQRDDAKRMTDLTTRLLQVYEKRSKTAHQEALEIIDEWKPKP
jgi:DNA repair exonuclease SbcCD nuclease subunit